MRILAVIPAFNEEACIRTTVQGLISACPNVDYLVVNDGSSDATEQILEESGIAHVCLPINTGLASAFRTGMKYAQRNGYDVVVQFDADGQHLPEYIGPMANALVSQNADIVIASRVLAGGGPAGMRSVGSHIIAALIRLTTGLKLTDPTSGMRMYSRKMIELYADRFDLTPEPDDVALMARNGARVVEIPAQMQERQGGMSYLNIWSSARYMGRMIVSIALFQWFR